MVTLSVLRLSLCKTLHRSVDPDALLCQNALNRLSLGNKKVQKKRKN